MGSEMIPILQMGIYIIIAIMIGLVVLYIYLMQPKKTKQADTRSELIEDEEDKEKKTEQNYGKFTGNLTRESIF